MIQVFVFVLLVAPSATDNDLQNNSMKVELFYQQAACQKVADSLNQEEYQNSGAAWFYCSKQEKS